MWQRVIEPLSHHFHVIAIDLPGFGESDCPPRNFSTGDFSNFLVLVMNRLSIDNAILAGISYGGQIAARVSYKHPERVRKLVLIASTGLVTHNFVKHTMFWTAFSFVAKYIVLPNRFLMRLSSNVSFYSTGSRPPDLLEKFHRQISADGKRNAWIDCLQNIYFPTDDFEKKLADLSIPTLIVWGERDKTVPVRYARRFHELIPNSALMVFAECAHSLPLEKPEELCAAIVEFVGPGRSIGSR